MKTRQVFYSLFFFATLLLFSGCGDDEDPVKENEEELITTVKLTFTEGANSFEAEWKDADGDGANEPVVDNIALEVGRTYTVSIDLLNESVTPAESINSEVEEEALEHQLFYVVGGGLDLAISYDDEDAEGNPIGLLTNFTAGAAGSGSLTIILRHEPVKTASGVAEGNPTNAGGETDIETVPAFEVTIQ